MEADGPEALMPAQVTQFCQPVIAWIWDFTVCADDGRDTAAKRNSATARTDKLLVVFFNITNFYSRGFCFRRSLPRDCWRLPTHLLWNNPFSSSAEKSRKQELLGD